MPPSLYLIDGHALAYRTYFALSMGGSASQRWQTSKGEPTAGIYGFATVLLRIIEQEKPDYLAVAFDTGKTFRDDIFPEYKGTRAKMPEDLRPQIERIRQLVDSFNIPRLEMEGYEADDVLGSVAKQAAAQGLGVKIITGDRDLLQLVGDHVIVNLAGNKLSEAKDYATPEAVKEYFGVPPHQVVDYKGLVGDTSDNIPGVKGIGEKSAQTLFETYQSLDDIYAHLDEIKQQKKALGTKLEEGKQSAYLSRDLALIRTDLPIKLDLEHARTAEFDPTKVEALFRELEFRSLIQRLSPYYKSQPDSAPATRAAKTSSGQMPLFDSTPQVIITPRPVSKIEVKIADNDDAFGELLKDLKSAKEISFDTETTSVDEMQADLVGISLSTRAGVGWYIPVGHAAGRQLPLEKILTGLREPMTNPRIPKIGHNLKYDYLILARRDLRVTPLTFDTMIAEWITDPSSRNLGLKNLSQVRLGEEMTHIETLIGTGKKQISMAEVEIESAAPYAAADAEMCVRLKAQLEAELKKVGGTKLMNEVEMPLINVLAEMELSGVKLDLPFFQKMSQELGTRLNAIELQVYQAVGKTFNINSTQQLSDVIFKTLRIPPPPGARKTASGHYSTAADVLESLSGQHPVLDLILEHRELSKLKSTYVDALPAAVDTHGRVHTSYSQTGAITGRLSSNNPNLQNIPTRSELGRRVRHGFIADPKNVLLSVDYSQVELRIVAHMAQDEAMLNAFRAGQDIHAATAAAIYSVPLDQVTKDQRRHAKAINFGLIYGMSAFGLTRSTELTLSESEAFVKAYFERFPGVKHYLDETRKRAASDGYVETLLGRRRYFPALKGGTNMQMKNREEREAINSPIQGTAADVMKIAMIRIPEALEQAGLSGKMLLQVHDELVLECPEKELKKTVGVVQQVMENAYPFDVPLLTDARFGLNWGEMQPVR